MNEFKEIIASLSKSPYLVEWILKLKNNEVLFSPTKNIKACVKVDEKSVRSSFWDGLTIIEAYCSRGLSNDEVDNFIISLLRNSINIFLNDKESEKYKKLNSSEYIVKELFDICISRPKFIDSVDVVSLIKTYFDSPLCWPFTIPYEMAKNRGVLLRANKDIVFEMYKMVVELVGEKEDCTEYLNIDYLIKENADKYYLYSVKYIKELDKHFYDMGSFAEYNFSLSKQKHVVVFNWLKSSSKFINKDLLQHDIQEMLTSNSELLNKAGLCLLGLNFEQTKKILFNNLKLVFNKENFYADLRFVFSNNSFQFLTDGERKQIENELSCASFGLNNEKTVSILRNHLAGILRAKGFDVIFNEESHEEKDFAINFNKRFYEVSHDRAGDIQNLKNKLNKLSIEQASDYYHKCRNSSYYFEDIINTAFISYLLDNFEDDFIEYLDKFDSGLAIGLISHFSSSESKNFSNFIKIVKKVLLLMKNDSKYVVCLNLILFNLSYYFKNENRKDIEEVINLIDYKLIKIDEYKNDTNINVISICINEPLYCYLDVVSLLAYNEKKEWIRQFEIIVDYYLKTFNFHKMKSLVCCFYQRILYFDFNYAMKLKDFIFDNELNSENLSYPLLSLINNYNEELLTILYDSKGIFDYFKHHYKSGDLLSSQTVISIWFFMCFLKKGKYEDVINLYFENSNLNAIGYCLFYANIWLENKQLSNDDLKRFELFLVKISQNVCIFQNDDANDQMIRKLSKTIVLNDNKYPFIWEALICLFKTFKHFLSDEAVKLFQKYKISEYAKVSKIIGLYFRSYRQYYSSEKTLVTVFNMVANESKYRKKVEMWRVSLIEKNPELANKLIIN